MPESSANITPQSFSSFGELLRYLRKRARLSQQELAALVDYHYTYISYAENNARLPDLSTLKARFIPALRIADEPQWALRLLELAAEKHFSQGKPAVQSEQAYHVLPNLVRILGREQEITALKKILLKEDARLLTIVGPPGCGKTSLALSLAAELEHNFPHGALFVDVAPARSADAVLRALAAALGMLETSDLSSLRAVQSFLMSKNALIIMDNFEQALSAAAQLSAILKAAPAIKFLVTSREALRVEGEREFQLATLPTPDTVQVNDFDWLDRFPSTQLFVQRALAAKPDFKVTEENAPLIAELCRRLDGLPLAIELAAARIQILSPAEMLEKFDRRFDWLTRGRRDIPEWRQTLAGALEWSYSLLTKPACLLLNRLSVFEGGWTLEAAEAICSDSFILRRGDILGWLLSLTDHSLVVAEAAGGKKRYRFLDTILYFAREKLKEAGEWDDLRIRHLGYYAGWADALQSALDETPPLEMRARVEMERNNIHAALSWGLITESRPEPALNLVAAIGSVWLKHSNFKEALKWVTEYLPRSHAHPRLRARLLFLATALSYWRDQHEPARAYGMEGLQLAGSIADTFTLADIQTYLSDICREMGDLDAALIYAQQCVALCREIGYPFRLSLALTSLGIVHHKDGRRAEATRVVAEALSIAEQNRNLWAQSYALRVRADLLRFDRQFAESYSAFQRALEVSTSADDRISVGMELANMALLANVLGDYSASAAYARKALTLFQSIGNEYQQPFPLRMLAYAALHENALAHTRAFCMESLRGNYAIGHKAGILACLLCLAALEFAAGNTALAWRLFQMIEMEMRKNELSFMEPDEKEFALLAEKLRGRRKSPRKNIPSFEETLRNLIIAV